MTKLHPGAIRCSNSHLVFCCCRAFFAGASKSTVPSSLRVKRQTPSFLLGNKLAFLIRNKLLLKQHAFLLATKYVKAFSWSSFLHFLSCTSDIHSFQHVFSTLAPPAGLPRITHFFCCEPVWTCTYIQRCFFLHTFESAARHIHVCSAACTTRSKEALPVFCSLRLLMRQLQR